MTTLPGLSDEYPYRPSSDPRSNDQPSESTAATFPQLLDMETVARRLGTSIRHVRRLVTERKIPYLKIGHFIRFDERDVESWIDRQKVIRLDDAVETREGSDSSACGEAPTLTAATDTLVRLAERDLSSPSEKRYSWRRSPARLLTGP